MFVLFGAEASRANHDQEIDYASACERFDNELRASRVATPFVTEEEMHRDLKLGLALAVLLIGSTAAFFFRNDSDPDAGLPQLKNASALDRAVAEHDVAPYISTPAPAASPAQVVASPWTKPAFLGGAVASSALATPDPIQIVMEEELDIAAMASRPVATSKSVAAEHDADGTPIHVVQSGDTLSGIAGRYLGSIARFDEIFELNRDQLKGPHDLKIGMRLRLPNSSYAALPAASEQSALPESEIVAKEVSLTTTDEPDATSQQADAAGTDSDKPDETARIPGEGLFKPAKRTPFVPSRYRAPKLSQ